MIHAFASLPHYARHLWPIWAAIPAEHRGGFWSSHPGSWWGAQLAKANRPTEGTVLVASHQDALWMTGLPLIHVEHGAGQRYPGDRTSATSGGYAGGIAAPYLAARLFLTPGEAGAAAWRARYDVPAVAVGCPKLDPWHDLSAPRPPATTVAFTFHWDCQLIPETESALRHYMRRMRDIIGGLQKAKIEVLWHHHPKAGLGPRGRMTPTNPFAEIAATWGVELVHDEVDVLNRAGLLVADNTSMLYEFAALDRPVVVLNAPWYRRQVNHGMRFWDLIPGPQVDQPAQLVDVVLEAAERPGVGRALRERVSSEVYAHRGDAAIRAARAIEEVIGWP